MPNNGRFKGRVVLITGASSGIGKATAEVFAREGADIAIVARREKLLLELAKELENKHGVQAFAVKADVRDEQSVNRMVEATVGKFSRIDIVVNNAGMTVRDVNIETLSTKDYRTMMETNCDGMFFTTRATLPYLRKSQGNLIFLGSYGGKFPEPGNPIYGATKWWTRGFAFSLAGIAGQSGVAVSIINASGVWTDIGLDSGWSPKTKYSREEISGPEEIAEAILFAARQAPTSTASEIDIFWRDKFSQFLAPRTITKN